MGEWIEWSGGKQPVADGTMVRVRFADGEEQDADARDMRDLSGDDDYNWWEHRDCDGWQDCYVAAYRVLA